MRDFKNIKVAVAGTGYVGLSIATLLAQHHHAGNFLHLGLQGKPE